MRKNAEKMDLSSRNRLLRVPTGSGHMTRALTLGGSLYPWHSLGNTLAHSECQGYSDPLRINVWVMSQVE